MAKKSSETAARLKRQLKKKKRKKKDKRAREATVPAINNAPALKQSKASKRERKLIQEAYSIFCQVYAEQKEDDTN